MSARIGGMGWVTPLGSGIDYVWQRLLVGERAALEILRDDETGVRYLINRVPAESLKNVPPHPRLRRASAISRFAAAAGLAALADAKNSVDPQRIALVFAIANGGVIYTRRFYSEIVKSGAQSASPLLFPETVFNAPASHLAAILGVSGASYTVVGDGAVGILALKLAEDLIASADVDAVLVVAAEEIDQLVCEAYRRWRLLRDPRKPESSRGMIVSEGAGALLLKKTGGDFQIEKVDPGANYFRRAEASTKLRRVVEHLGESSDVRIGSANGTFVDRAERVAFAESRYVYSPKMSLGDSIGASVLWQVIVAAEALRFGNLPGIATPISGSRALVLACGLNQQLGGLTLRFSRDRQANVCA